MTGHEYLKGLLASQNLSDEQTDYLQNLRQEIEAVLRDEYGHYPRIYYGGSYGKDTIIRESFDLDLIIYFPHTTNCSLENIYHSVHQTLRNANYRIQPKNVSLQVQVSCPWQFGFHVDVVPGRAKNKTYKSAYLYKNNENCRMLTSLKHHIYTVRNSKCRPLIKLMKLWRIRHKLQWKTFALEQTVIRALKGSRKHNYERCLFKVFEFIADELTQTLLVDPANRHNIIELPYLTQHYLKNAAETSLNAQSWDRIIW